MKILVTDTTHNSKPTCIIHTNVIIAVRVRSRYYDCLAFGSKTKDPDEKLLLRGASQFIRVLSLRTHSVYRLAFHPGPRLVRFFTFGRLPGQRGGGRLREAKEGVGREVRKNILGFGAESGLNAGDAKYCLSGHCGDAPAFARMASLVGKR